MAERFKYEIEPMDLANMRENGVRSLDVQCACGFRRLRPGIPIEHGHAFRSKAATCSDEGGRGVVAGMRSWVRFS
jgi:hypothetical protein